jgi:hypothetical protein
MIFRENFTFVFRKEGHYDLEAIRFEAIKILLLFSTNKCTSLLSMHFKEKKILSYHTEIKSNSI